MKVCIGRIARTFGMALLFIIAALAAVRLLCSLLGFLLSKDSTSEYIMHLTAALLVVTAMLCMIALSIKLHCRKD
jgi:hypothetical protein